MHIITTAADLRHADEFAHLPHALVEEVDSWLWDIWRATGGGNQERFSLEETGPIVILEASDLPAAVPGGCRKGAEWADVVAFDGAPFYDAGVLEGNERCWRILGRVGALHPAVEAYLIEEVHAGGQDAEGGS